MEGIKFYDEVYKFSNPIKTGSKNNLAYWEFEGSPSLIEEMTSSCGCTTPTLEGNKIVAFYNAGSTSGDFERSVFVYYKDGKPKMVKDARTGNMVPNPAKARTVLKLKGKLI